MRWAFVDSWRADSPCLSMARSRNYPMLQKSPSGLCEIEICNYRIGAPLLLNRCCAFQPDVESIFLAEMLKILLQHYLPLPDSGTEAFGVLKFRPMHAVNRECSTFSVSSG